MESDGNTLWGWQVQERTGKWSMVGAYVPAVGMQMALIHRNERFVREVLGDFAREHARRTRQPLRYVRFALAPCWSPVTTEGGDSRDVAFEAAERFQRERDEARARVTELESEGNARLIALEAAKNAAEAKAAKFASVCQNIVNNPRLPREQVQSQLLLVIQQTGEG